MLSPNLTNARKARQLTKIGGQRHAEDIEERGRPLTPVRDTHSKPAASPNSPHKDLRCLVRTLVSPHHEQWPNRMLGRARISQTLGSTLSSEVD